MKEGWGNRDNYTCMLLRKKVLRVGLLERIQCGNYLSKSTKTKSKTKEVFTRQEAWLSPKTFLTMFHRKTVGIITWLPSIGRGPLSASLWTALWVEQWEPSSVPSRPLDMGNKEHVGRIDWDRMHVLDVNCLSYGKGNILQDIQSDTGCVHHYWCLPMSHATTLFLLNKSCKSIVVITVW